MILKIQRPIAGNLHAGYLYYNKARTVQGFMRVTDDSFMGGADKVYMTARWTDDGDLEITGEAEAQDW